MVILKSKVSVRDINSLKTTVRDRIILEITVRDISNYNLQPTTKFCNYSPKTAPFDL